MEKGLYESRPVVSVTFDTDNCPEKAIEFVQERLDRHKIVGTFFCTQRYRTLRKPHEAALHPFLTDFQRLDKMFSPLYKLKNDIPEAVGNRCHGLTCNGALYRTLREEDFLYDSSWPMYLQRDIKPIHLHTGIIELPLFFPEYMALEEEPKTLFMEQLRTPGLKVLLFHPVHLYHNSTPTTYADILKVPYPERYRPELIAEGYGILNFFDEVLEMLEKEDITCATCKNIALVEQSD